MQATIPSAEVQAKAKRLLSERDRWRYVRNQDTGVSFVAIPSGEHVYQVHPTGRGCSCQAYQLGGLLCSHRVAMIEAAHEDSMAASLDEDERLGLASMAEIDCHLAGVAADAAARADAERRLKES